MKIAVSLVLLSATAFAQLPDAPKDHRVPEKAAFAAALTFEVATDRYDISQTEKGLKAGVAIEGNTFLLGTNKPTAGQLWKIDAVFTAITITPSVLAYIFHKKEWFYAGLACPFAYGLRHIQGGKQWATLLKEKP